MWTECWRISLCLNGSKRKRKDNPTHSATLAVSHRGRLRERLQTATHETGAQIANRIRVHAGTHAVSHRGRPRARTQTTTHGTGAQTNLKRTHDTSHAVTNRGRPRARTQTTTVAPTFVTSTTFVNFCQLRAHQFCPQYQPLMSLQTRSLLLSTRPDHFCQPLLYCLLSLLLQDVACGKPARRRYCMHVCKVQSAPTSTISCISSFNAYSYIQQTGRAEKPTGRAAKPTGRAEKPTRRAAKPTRRAEKPSRRAAKPTGRAAKPTGRAANQPKEPRNQPEESRNQLEEPRNQPEEPKNQPEDPRNQPEEPRN